MNNRDAMAHVQAGHNVVVDWALYAWSTISPEGKVPMKPEGTDNADGTPTVSCLTCQINDIEWSNEMEWV